MTLYDFIIWGGLNNLGEGWGLGKKKKKKKKKTCKGWEANTWKVRKSDRQRRMKQLSV